MDESREPSTNYYYRIDVASTRIIGRSVTTVAGYAGWSDEESYFPGHGFRDGPNNQARFNNPRGMAVASDGTIYVADMDNHVIRMIKR